jgi:pyruvate-formate lyase-activating enzyme
MKKNLKKTTISTTNPLSPEKLRKRWNLTDPDIDHNFIATKTLINLSGKNYRKLLSEITYGAENEKEILIATDKNNLLFKPMHPNDHLATSFFPVEKNQGGENLLRLTICQSGKYIPEKSLIVSLQDQNCNTLHSVTCYVSTEKPSPDRYKKQYLILPQDVERLRVTVLSPNGAHSCLPEVIVLEQVVLPNRSLEEKKVISNILESSRKEPEKSSIIQTRETLFKRWKISEPLVDNHLVVVKEFFNLFGDNLKNLDKITYESTGDSDILTENGRNNLLFKPLHKDDHLSTNFVNIKTDNTGEHLFRLILCYSKTSTPRNYCTITIQDENCNTLLSIPCGSVNEVPSSEKYQKKYLKIPTNVERVRITISSTENKPAYLPVAIILDHVLLHNLTEKEHKVANSVLKNIFEKPSKLRKPLSRKELTRRWNIRDSLASNNFILKKLLYNISGDNFISLDQILYENKENNKIFIEKDHKIVFFKPINKNDHLATQPVDIKSDIRGKNLLRLLICYPEKNIPSDRLTISLQDQKCNMLFSVSCITSEKTPACERYEQHYLIIPPDVEKVRMVVSSNDGSPTYLPEAIIVEHFVLPYLTEEEKKETVNLLKIISPIICGTRYPLTSKQVKKWWNIYNPDIDDNFFLIKKLFNLSGYNYLEKLEKITYGTGEEKNIFSETDENIFLLKPTFSRDHLATPWVDIKTDKRGENFLKLTVCYPEITTPGKNCILIIQDQNKNPLFLMNCYLATKTPISSRFNKKYLAITDALEKIRILILSNDGSPTYLPQAVLLEHTVLPKKVIEKEKDGQSKNILKQFMDKQKIWMRLSLLRDEFNEPRFDLSEYEKLVAQYSKEDLKDYFKDDPWFANYIINIWENIHGETELTTYPWNVCIPIADTCNATCPFCNSWIRGTRQLDLEESSNFLPLLRNAKFFGFAGHGEPLMHTDFVKIAERIHGSVDPRCAFYLVTNGALLGRYLDMLLEMNFQTFNISLNASSPETHHKVMGFRSNTFDQIISCIERLVAIRRKSTKQQFPIVNISMVVLNQNIHEVASFIEMGNQLKVNHIHLNTLMPQSTTVQGLNYHTLPPYLNPDFVKCKKEAIQAIAASRINVIGSPESWDTPIFPQHIEEQIKINPPPLVSEKEVRKNRVNYLEKPPPDTRGCLLIPPSPSAESEKQENNNTYGRTPRYKCRAVYYVLNLNDFNFVLNPCCYIERNIPGFEPVIYDGSYDFFEAWNSPAMVELRKRLKDGPLYDCCKRCPPQ